MSEWRPIETLEILKAQKEVNNLFWLVPHNKFVNTSGETIFSPISPHLWMGKWRCWSSFYSATHWLPLPEPPREQP